MVSDKNCWVKSHLSANDLPAMIYICHDLKNEADEFSSHLWEQWQIAMANDNGHFAYFSIYHIIVH